MPCKRCTSICMMHSDFKFVLAPWPLDDIILVSQNEIRFALHSAQTVMDVSCGLDPRTLADLRMKCRSLRTRPKSHNQCCTRTRGCSIRDISRSGPYIRYTVISTLIDACEVTACLDSNCSPSSLLYCVFDLYAYMCWSRSPCHFDVCALYVTSSRLYSRPCIR